MEWQELRALSGRDKPIGDFPYLWGVYFGVFTERSLEVLRDMISPHVELLPLSSRQGEFTAFKVLTIVDALDRERSDIEWAPQLKRQLGNPRVVRRVKKFVFREERLVDQVLFRLPELPWDLFVTDVFMRAVEQHQLAGFEFTQVWPPIDERAKFLEKRLKRKKK